MAPNANDNLQPSLPIAGGEGGAPAHVVPATPVFEDPLLKSLRRPEMPSGTKHRIIPSLWQMNSYKGISDPRKLTSVTYEVLEMMSNTHIVRSYIDHIIRTCQRYGRRPRRRGDYGFRIEMRAPDVPMTSELRDEAEMLTQLVEEGGRDYVRTTDGQIARWDGRGEERAVRFYQLLGMLIEDSLVYDSAGVRMEMPEKAELHPIYQEHPEARQYGSPHPPVWFAPVSGRRLRVAEQTYSDRGEVEARAGGAILPTQQHYEPEIRPELGEYVAYVELGLDGNVQREFAWNEVAHLVRNPRSDSWTVGYGRSELEQAIQLVTGLATGVAFNVSYFTDNHVPDGILSLTGDWGEERLQQWQNDVRANVGGPGNYHRLPVLFSEDPQARSVFLATRADQRLDMYWREWITWLITAIGSRFGWPPEAIGFASYKGSGSTLQEADPSTRLIHGEDSALVPLLLDVESWLNENIIWRIDRRFVFRFVNLRERDEARQWELTQAKLSTNYYTINDAHKELGEPEVRCPLDRKLWRHIERSLTRTWPTLTNDPAELERLTAQVYESENVGGEYALWPDAPGSVAGHVFMQEFAEQIGGGQQEGMPMGPDDLMGMGALGPGGGDGFGAPGSGDEAGLLTGGQPPPGSDIGEDERDAILEAFQPPSPEGAAGMDKSVVPDALTQGVGTEGAATDDDDPAYWARVLDRLDSWRAAVAKRLNKSLSAVMGDRQP